MEQRLDIHAITPEISDWTCKVQLVVICRPGEGKERKIRYMNMILQDEQKNQVKAIVYGDDILLYQQRLKLFSTYLITSARVQQSTFRYEKPLHTYEWIIDKRTIIDSIDKDESDDIVADPLDPYDLDEDKLPPPTIINMTSFREINEEATRSTKEQLRDAEFSMTTLLFIIIFSLYQYTCISTQTITSPSPISIDVLAIVVNCFPPRYVASLHKRLQEVILIDTSKQAFTFTLWEETIIEDEGTRLLTQFPKHPIILARDIAHNEI